MTTARLRRAAVGLTAGLLVALLLLAATGVVTSAAAEGVIETHQQEYWPRTLAGLQGVMRRAHQGLFVLGLALAAGLYAVLAALVPRALREQVPGVMRPLYRARLLCFAQVLVLTALLVSGLTAPWAKIAAVKRSYPVVTEQDLREVAPADEERRARLEGVEMWGAMKEGEYRYYVEGRDPSYVAHRVYLPVVAALLALLQAVVVHSVAAKFAGR